MSDQSPGKNASLRLAEPAELAGAWRITGEGRAPCLVTLRVDRVEAANAYALVDEAECLAGLLSRPVAGWRPVPDGIELAGPDRLTLLLFAYAGDVARAPAPDGRGELLLTRR